MGAKYVGFYWTHWAQEQQQKKEGVGGSVDGTRAGERPCTHPSQEAWSWELQLEVQVS